MKIKLLLLCLLIIFFKGFINAQDIFYPEIEPYLSDVQKQELEKSINILLKARGNENNANDIERKYAKLKKRGNQEAWMEKTWEAKEQRILAEKNYKLAYRTISDVYSKIITKSEYINNDSKTKALSLNNQALEKFEDANSILSEYTETSQETLAVTANEKLDSALHQSHILKLSGIELQIEALQIYIEKGKTKSNAKEELAWENAKKTNTISSYYDYLNNNPRGKHMAEANESISKLEKLSLSNDVVDNNSNRNKNQRGTQNNSNNVNNSNSNSNNDSNTKTNTNNSLGNLKFKVQIAASITELSSWMLNAKAPGIKNIETIQTDGWIKYFVGEFSNYLQATKFRDELRSHTPDAFIVVFSNGNQIKVTEEMKN